MIPSFIQIQFISLILVQIRGHLDLTLLTAPRTEKKRKTIMVGLGKSNTCEYIINVLVINLLLYNFFLIYRFDSKSYHPLSLEQYRTPLTPRLKSEVCENKNTTKHCFLILNDFLSASFEFRCKIF